MATKTEEKPADETPTVAETMAPEPLGHAKQPTRITQMEHAVMLWHHVAQPGESPEQFMHLATWAHVAKSLQVGHEIIVVAAEGNWRLHLYVRAVGRNEVVVGTVSFAEFGRQEEIVDDVPYAVAWRGPSAKWSVVSKETKAIVKDNFATQEQAAQWVAQHLKALAA